MKSYNQTRKMCDVDPCNQTYLRKAAYFTRKLRLGYFFHGIFWNIFELRKKNARSLKFLSKIFQGTDINCSYMEQNHIDTGLQVKTKLI